MTLKVRVPTVLSQTERPYVELIFDEEAFHLGVADARIASEWMRFAGAWLESSPTFSLGDALERALGVLQHDPPRRIEDHVVGALKAQNSAGEPTWFSVAVEMGTRDPQHPRLRFNISESLGDDGEAQWTGDTWWISDDEARTLSAALREGAGEVGDFLFVRGAKDPEHERTDGVELRFADSVVEESGEDGILWVGTPDAERIAGWLESALAWARLHPAHLFSPPEPDPVTLAELPL
jgi:hypothetical protein